MPAKKTTKKKATKKVATKKAVENTVVKPVEPKATSFAVISEIGNVMRTYTIERHGEDAEKLAEMFAKKKGLSVKK